MEKVQFELEIPIHASPNMLYQYISSPSNLQEWFADKVDEWENVFSFSWNKGVPEKAELVDQEPDKFIRFRWLHGEKNEYFEFRIEKTD